MLHSLQTNLEMSCGSFILAFWAIFLAECMYVLARSGRVDATELDCSHRYLILALARVLVDFLGFLRFLKCHDLVVME